MVAATALVAALAGLVSAPDPTIYQPRDTAQSWSCQPRKTCGKIGSCEEAEYYLYNCSWGGKLDGDGDGAPCETLCGSNN
ncbi:MAG: nuclease [Devosia sp.]|nr:excalibur calcium-binding domain-containing protein [Devosia sp.]MDB5539033.1 nuclease [Devosia sp.]